METLRNTMRSDGFPTVDTPEPGQKFHLNGQ